MEEISCKKQKRYFGLSVAGAFCWFTTFLVSLTSCEKVIQLNLNNSAPKVVIQGTVNDQPGPYFVKISRTVNFQDTNNYPPVTGANVVISDNAGQSELLTESEPGTYKTSGLKGIAGRTYNLSVKTGSETFQSVAYMPYPVKIDSISFAPSPFSGRLTTYIRFDDPADTVNFYRFVYFVNNVEKKGYYTMDDELFKGATIKYAMMGRGTDGVKLVVGDKVTVWSESIDKGVYDYFRTASNDNEQSASPANPVSNISNGALGYFNVCSVRKISATVGK